MDSKDGLFVGDIVINPNRRIKKLSERVERGGFEYMPMLANLLKLRKGLLEGVEAYSNFNKRDDMFLLNVLMDYPYEYKNLPARRIVFTVLTDIVEKFDFKPYKLESKIYSDLGGVPSEGRSLIIEQVEPDNGTVTDFVAYEGDKLFAVGLGIDNPHRYELQFLMKEEVIVPIKDILLDVKLKGEPISNLEIINDDFKMELDGFYYNAEYEGKDNKITFK